MNEKQTRPFVPGIGCQLLKSDSQSILLPQVVHQRLDAIRIDLLDPLMELRWNQWPFGSLDVAIHVLNTLSSGNDCGNLHKIEDPSQGDLGPIHSNPARTRSCSRSV